MEDIYCYDNKATRKAEREYNKSNAWMMKLNVGRANVYMKASSYWMDISKMHMEVVNEEEYNKLVEDWQIENWAIYYIRN